MIGFGFSDVAAAAAPVLLGNFDAAASPELLFDFCFRYSSMGNGGLKTD